MGEGVRGPPLLPPPLFPDELLPLEITIVMLLELLLELELELEFELLPPATSICDNVVRSIFCISFSLKNSPLSRFAFRFATDGNCSLVLL